MIKKFYNWFMSQPIKEDEINWSVMDIIFFIGASSIGCLLIGLTASGVLLWH